MTSTKPLMLLDLFAGAGGMSLGFRLAGCVPVAAVEYSPESVCTYRHNHAKLGHCPTVFQEDIWRRDLVNRVVGTILTEHGRLPDILTAGLPCETFSVAQRKRNADDKRNFLYRRVLNFVDRVKPRIVVIENVRQLKTAWGGTIYADLVGRLSRLGYRVTDWILNAADYGVPQTRTRLFIIAIRGRRSASLPPEPPVLGTQVSIQDALEDVPLLVPTTGVRESREYVAVPKEGSYSWLMRVALAKELGLCPSPVLLNHQAQRHNEAMVNRFAAIRAGMNLKTLLADEATPPTIRQSLVGYTRHRRPLLYAPSYTVTAHVADELLHPLVNRILTPREAARLQSFPDWYEFLGPRSGHHGNAQTQDWYEQIGDAVPPLLARAIASHLLDWIATSDLS